MPVKTVTIDDTTYYPWTLARMAGVSDPENDTTTGATFLLGIADTYLTERDRIREADYPSDELSEMADSAVTVYTGEQWEIFTDLQLYQVESDLLGETTAQEFLDKGPVILLYEVASNLFSMLGWEHDREAMEK